MRTHTCTEMYIQRLPSAHCPGDGQTVAQSCDTVWLKNAKQGGADTGVVVCLTRCEGNGPSAGSAAMFCERQRHSDEAEGLRTGGHEERFLRHFLMATRHTCHTLEQESRFYQIISKNKEKNGNYHLLEDCEISIPVQPFSC